MQHGTVCIILDDGTSTCPPSLLAKKQAVDQQMRIHLTLHDRIKLMKMQDLGINLNQLIAASKVIDFYNEAKQREGLKSAAQTIRFGFNTARILSGRLAEISRSFVDKMDHLNAMQFRLIGAQGKELAIARTEFKAAYFAAMDELNKVARLNFISADTQQYFNNEARMRAFGRAGVYVNDFDDVERLRRIAELTQSINSAIAKFGFLAVATEIVFDAATGGNWQKDVRDIVVEYLVGRAVGFFFGLLTPGGWVFFIIECVSQALTEESIQYLIAYPELMKKTFRSVFNEIDQSL